MTNLTVLPQHFMPYLDVPKEKKYKPWLPTPPSLVVLAGDADSFVKNFINGRRLLWVDACVCPKIGIHDFDHIKRITASIRKLFNVEREMINRSISLPPHYPLTHYLLFRVPTGPKKERTTRTQLFRAMSILDKEKPCPFGHWEMIEPSQLDFPCNRFGYVKRKSVYDRVEHNRQPRDHTYLKRSLMKPNYFYRIDIK
ncbi:uncharacterized protein LOC105702454 [Orussus abietinus]|uniref:uncharacterized protein LOC105702454 n=1 Tax=Orussus abietinus TaxID=222816 RepID=UPI00062505A1|nr:uncharacterized protein LOC105702454 [Orussus abietinus]